MKLIRIHFVITIMTIMGISACTTSENNKQTIVDIILPEGSSGNEEFIEKIGAINVIQLQIGDDYFYLDDPAVYVGDNYVYCLEKKTLKLMCFDKKNGQKLFSKPIKGRGPGECIEVDCMTGMADTLFLYDVTCGLIKKYNPNGKYLGNQNKDGLKVMSIYPMSNGNYISFDMRGSGYEDEKCITTFDSNFNIVSTEMNVPTQFSDVISFSVGGSTNSWYMINDTLRFMFPFSHKLVLYPGYQTYNFVSSNPITDAQKNEFKDDISAYVDASLDGYESAFEELIECRNSVMFKYSVNDITYQVLMNRKNLDVLTMTEPEISLFEGDDVTTADLWGVVVHGSHMVATDGEKIYAIAHLPVFVILDKYKDRLDSKLTHLHNEMLQNIKSNVETSIDGYNFLISIKLTD